MADSPLQKAPYGLLGAFDLKTRGEQPSRFFDGVQPTTDVTDFYVAPNSMVYSNTQAVVAPAASAQVELNPLTPRTVWRIRAIGAQINLNAADATARRVINLEIGDGSSPILRVPVILGQELNPSGLAYDSARAGILFHRPFFLPPGWRITTSGVLGAAPANNWSLVLRVLVDELPA